MYFCLVGRLKRSPGGGKGCAMSEISGVDSTLQTATLAQALSQQQVQGEVVMKMLQQMQQMELQMMQSLGMALNVNIQI